MTVEVKVPTLGESVTEATIGEWLKQPGDPVKLDEPVASLETEFKYEGYLRRQTAAVDRQRRQETRTIPEGFPFEGIPGLSREMVDRLSQVRPATLGQASRIPGVTPAAVAVLSCQIEKGRPGRCPVDAPDSEHL